MTLDEQLVRFEFIMNIREWTEPEGIEGNGDKRVFVAERPTGTTITVNPDYYAPLPEFLTFHGQRVFIHKNTRAYQQLVQTDLAKGMLDDEKAWKKSLYGGEHGKKI